MIYARTAAGSRLLRDLVYRAWLKSSLQAAKSPLNPTDESNPKYNPQTGSAPPPHHHLFGERIIRAYYFHQSVRPIIKRMSSSLQEVCNGNPAFIF
jgi:hypothetical protein